ncbi:NitT/TauT family transport system permease protein [Microvirga flocculans]|uniref:NitT/TauT family transport system permease protein n=1 Tax=Microvirga flocculans TaxID=217168 RepID=A0A7W6IHX7_9HYPH|nr:ABC transporter permease [Microvirga flocculans]MBB4041204.1 NitT/TauT family transport system permease protein [Microvirga flocculans]
MAPFIFTLGFFILWEILCLVLNISSFILPAPSTILQAVWEYRSQLTFHAMHTLWMTLSGFSLAVGFGLLLGMVLGSSRLINAGTYPLLVGFNAIPKVAVVPILVFWFGVGWVPPVMTAFLISFFPIVVNVATGIATVEPEMEDVLRALGASKRDIVFKVGVPRAMPYFFGSLKVAITLAYVGSVIGEQNASNVGIGNLLTRASAAFEVPLVWAALLVLAVLGVAMYALTASVEHSVTGWAQRSQMVA